MIGLVIKSVGNLYTVKSANLLYKCNYRGKNKLDNNFSNPIVSGDMVEFDLIDKENGIIDRVLERTNYFIKRSLKDKKAHIIASNVDQALIIASFKNPYTKLNFIDKCIAGSFYYNISPIIIFNKVDSLSDREIKKLDDIIKIYNEINIKALKISAKKNLYIKELEYILKGKKTLLLGNSGVGKSTLINKISKVSNQKTDVLSSKTGRGKQTTTFSEIFEIDISGTVTDTPGFKDFYFFDIDKSSLQFLYPEFKMRDKCKFKNCLHKDEPGCSIKESLGEEVHEKRYNNYLSILSEIT